MNSIHSGDGPAGGAEDPQTPIFGSGAEVLTDAQVRDWLSHLPPGFEGVAGDVPADENLGDLIEKALTSHIDEADFLPLCERLGSGGRLRLFARMVSGIPDESPLLFELLTGHGEARQLIEGDFNRYTAALGVSFLEIISSIPEFMVAMKAAEEMARGIIEGSAPARSLHARS